MQDAWKKENDANISIYDQLARSHSQGYQVANWGSMQSQEVRFRVLYEAGITDCDSVLDVGCGVGDFYGWLRGQGFKGSYSGLDIAPGVVQSARQRHKSVEFIAGDLLIGDTVAPDRYDYIVASGIFAKRPESGGPYLEAVVAKMFGLCRKGVAFNSLSSWAPDSDASEFHADPIATLEFCRKLTPWVVLRADYHIRDFTIYLNRSRDHQ
jgi:SAM-dependent methyltransferase